MSIMEEVYAERFPYAMDRLAQICVTFEPEDLWQHYYHVVNEAADQLEAANAEVVSWQENTRNIEEQLEDKDTEIRKLESSLFELTQELSEKDEEISSMATQIRKMSDKLSASALDEVFGKMED